MTGTEAARTLELVAAAERAVVRLLLAMGEPVPHIGAASYYAVCTAAKLDRVWNRVECRIGPQPGSRVVLAVAKVCGKKARAGRLSRRTVSRFPHVVTCAVRAILDARKDGAGC